MTTGETVERLGGLELFTDARVTLDDGTVIEGRASPIDYDPERRLRLELESNDNSEVRYELSSTFDREDGEWEPVRVRQFEAGDDDWTELGEVDEVETPG